MNRTVAALARDWWVLVVAVILAVAVSVAWSMTRRPEYEAAATVKVDLSPESPYRSPGDAAALVNSGGLAAMAARASAFRLSSTARVHAEPAVGGHLVGITVRDLEPEAAARQANELAAVFAARAGADYEQELAAWRSRVDAERAALAEAQKKVVAAERESREAQARVRGLAGQDAIAAELRFATHESARRQLAGSVDSLRQQLAATQVDYARRAAEIQASDATIAAEAVAPTTAASPRPVRDAALAAVLAAALAIVGAVLRESGRALDGDRA